MTCKCEMNNSCNNVVTHLDEDGFVYCAAHGENRKAWKRCRKLKPSEMKKLEKGERITKY